MDADIVVIGAGPSGSSAAMKSARGGAETLLIEEHESVGYPPHCAGILYDPDFTKTSLKLPNRLIQACVKTAKIRISDVATIRLKAPFTIVDRPKMDGFFADLAVKSGATLLTQTKAINIKRCKKGVLIDVSRDGAIERVEAKGVVAADGFGSQIGRSLGLKIELELASCIQYEVKPSPLDSDEILEIYIGREYAPGGYAWVVPASNNRARMGLGVRDSESPAKMYLQKLLKSRCNSYETLKIMGHCIPLSGPLSETYDDNVLVVGDAAGQVIPSSGAGITSSIICGSIAGKTMVKALESKDFTSNILSRYQKEWERMLGNKYKATLGLKNMLDNLSENDVECIKDALKEKDVKYLMEQGKIFNVAMKIISKKPSLLKYTPTLYNARKYGIF